MDNDILEIVQRDFSEDEFTQVVEVLSTITVDHVMAKSEYNLRSARHAILKLAKGSINQVVELTECAKIDFRDVIMWSMEEDKS